MTKIYPFVKSVTNIMLLISVTLSFLCFPFIAMMFVHTICKIVFSLSVHSSQVAGTTAFIIVGLYSLVGIVYMYIHYFKNKHNF